MGTAEHVVYAGERFRIQASGRYFQSGRKDATERLLHRRVWLDNFGPIPEGMHVHHRNGDWRDNRPENLELVSASGHHSQHMRERWADPATAERMRDGLAAAVESARAWHATDEGRAWHVENGKRAWSSRQLGVCTCQKCGVQFESYWPTRARFCSKKCMRAAYYKAARVGRKCACCGTEFSAYVYREQRYCSLTCSNRSRGANEGVQPDP